MSGERRRTRGGQPRAQRGHPREPGAPDPVSSPSGRQAPHAVRPSGLDSVLAAGLDQVAAEQADMLDAVDEVVAQHVREAAEVEAGVAALRAKYRRAGR